VLGGCVPNSKWLTRPARRPAGWSSGGLVSSDRRGRNGAARPAQRASGSNCWRLRAGAGQPCGVIEIRTLTPAGWQVWRELRLAALAEAPAAFTSRLADWRDAEEERWRGRLAIPGSVNFVALLDGTLAGMASGLPGRDGTPQLSTMWISPAGRGKGVGDRLVQAVTQWAGQQGAAVLRLTVAGDNGQAAALYRRNGFADTDELAGTPAGTRQSRVMVKQLRPPASNS
jgi:ribosomal protein S18 acetylase RimI-like enzyme